MKYLARNALQSVLAVLAGHAQQAAREQQAVLLGDDAPAAEEALRHVQGQLDRVHIKEGNIILAGPNPVRDVCVDLGKAWVNG